MLKQEQRLDAKITPDLAIFIQLDELNGRLSKLTDLLEQMSAEGVRRTLVLLVTTTPQEVIFEAISYALVANTVAQGGGGATVYTEDTANIDRSANAAGIAAGESESVDLKRRQRVRFWIATASGTATVRVRILI